MQKIRLLTASMLCRYTGRSQATPPRYNLNDGLARDLLLVSRARAVPPYPLLAVASISLFENESSQFRARPFLRCSDLTFMS